MQRSEQNPRPFSAFYNVSNLVPGHGGPIDWENVPDDYAGGKYTVTLAADAAIGDDTITVDALTRPIKAGTILRGPEVASVVVTLTGNEAIGQTDLGVNALSGPIPAGAVLNFGVNEQAVLTADAAAGATSITVEPLDTAIESGDSATYEGGENNIEVLSDADTGDTSLDVGNLQFAIADNTELFGSASGSEGQKFIPQCTIMARHSVSGLLIPRSAAENSEESVGFLVSDANNAKSDAKSGYGIVIGGTPIYENLCPDADSSGNLPSAYKTELAANTLGFTYLDYSDDTA